MNAKLMPYGSPIHAGLLTKVGISKTEARLLPYGSADSSGLTAKVLVEGKFCSDPSMRRVIRMKAVKR